MFGSEWIWKRTLPSQDTSVLQEQLVIVQGLRERNPGRHRKYDRTISAIVSELASRTADGFVSAQGEESTVTLEATDPRAARAPILKLFQDALKRQQEKFAGQVHTEADERSVRLTALLDATFELYKSHVPGMDVALKETSYRRNMADKLTGEYMPLLMLDPDELPRIFVDYILWKFGIDQATRQMIDIEYLKEAFERGISLLPDEVREDTISGKHRFEWGKLV